MLRLQEPVDDGMFEQDKPVQIRPWKLSDADVVLDDTLPLDPRKTVFVGGVPRPLKAGRIALNCLNIINCFLQVLTQLPSNVSGKVFQYSRKYEDVA